jgi:DNA-binding NarL/FixJ family response regulator
MTLKILLVDDQDIIRQGLKVLLQLEPDLTVVGEAANGQLAIQHARQLQPDVILMDLRMPIMDGIAATRQICQEFPQIKVLVLTTFDDDVLITEAIQVGASGYLLKDTPSEELAEAIRNISRGYTQFGPGILQKVVRQMTTPLSEPPPPEVAELTPREVEVLSLIAAGCSNREIAARLFISEGTVKNHVTNILSRLGLRDRTQLAIFANDHKAWLQQEM